MSEHTPTTEFVRSVYEQARSDAFEWEIATPEELADKESSNDERFDRWLAEVERAAAEKALTEIRGIIAGQGWQPLWFFDKAVEAYRRNEGGRNAESS